MRNENIFAFSIVLLFKSLFRFDCLASFLLLSKDDNFLFRFLSRADRFYRRSLFIDRRCRRRRCRFETFCRQLRFHTAIWIVNRARGT